MLIPKKLIANSPYRAVSTAISRQTNTTNTQIMKISTKRTITSPAFLVLLLFAVRLIGITNPPLEKGHSWRQCTGLMVARNFYEGDDNIMYPRVDEAGAGTGIIGMEFPLLYHLHYRMASVFGYTHWYGRLINLIISSLGLWYFSRVLLRLRCSKRMAWVHIGAGCINMVRFLAQDNARHIQLLADACGNILCRVLFRR